MCGRGSAFEVGKRKGAARRDGDGETRVSGVSVFFLQPCNKFDLPMISHYIVALLLNTVLAAMQRLQ